MGSAIKRAKKELQEDASSSATWSWPKTPNKYKRQCAADSQRALIGYWSLGKKGYLIPVLLQLGQ
eukprot:8425291-Prorocentrum_lima.AAC.1